MGIFKILDDSFAYVWGGFLGLIIGVVVNSIIVMNFIEGGLELSLDGLLSLWPGAIIGLFLGFVLRKFFVIFLQF
jgi:hypothetical protein